MAAQLQKQPLHKLPISPHAPIYHLTPDPLFPTPASLFALGSYKPPAGLASNGPVALKEGDPVPPSMLRRSRGIRDGGAFTFTSPLPLEFPYDIQEPEEQQQEKRVGQEVQATATTIEESLARFEISPDAVVADDGGKGTAFSSAARQSSRFPKATLLSYSSKCAEEWLPQLELGAEGSKERELLVEVLAGKTVLAREAEGKDVGFAPWSLCYGGHQFGSWANQLGDGRAISILSTPTTPEVKEATGFSSLELQLKGAGRTPYSRFADGLAVLRSSIREYLGAEAMAALRLPTSRALALVGIPDVKVRRETVETAAIVTRVASSWIRIGNFEIQSRRQEWESLRSLTRFVGREVFEFKEPPADSKFGRGLGLHVLVEVAKRNAVMIAGWQAYGFMHGVMNTDNIAVTGACIDYGPYAFMDVFDSHHICNHSDDMGRYSFRNQPTMGMFAVTKLADALAELIGCELDIAKNDEGSGFVEVDEGWGEGGVEAGWMAGWRKAGVEKLEDVKTEFIDAFTNEYTRLMRLRLGFETAQKGDFDLISDLLDLLELHSLDFTNSIRILSQFTGTTSSHFSTFLDHLLPSDATTVTLPPTAREEWTKWLKKYEERLAAESSDASDRRLRMNLVNPRYTLRQWVLEETIQKLDHQKGSVEPLERALRMAGAPFEAYGEIEIGKEQCEVLSEEEKEERRLCGVGSAELLGFQCSCSS